MPAGPKETLWSASDHTIAKIDILQQYLTAYFQILGTSRRNQDFLYIDGFAGPNRYTNRKSGSPQAAIDAAELAIMNAGDSWIAGNIDLVFVEQMPRRYDNLVSSLSQNTSRVRSLTYNNEFTQALPDIKSRFPDQFNSSRPLFVFIDPFGVTGAPFSAVAEILDSPCSEVLINLDADGVSRIYTAKNANSDQTLTDVFGDESWKGKLHDGQSFSVQCREVLKIYKDRLRTLPGVKYIFEVEMQGVTGTLNYYLVFASKHPLGLMKMKEAMRSIAQNGTYQFADANVGQMALLRFDEPEAYHRKLYEHFKMQKVKYDSKSYDVTAFALNETPFTDAKSMLRILENEGFITASAIGNRRRGAFNDKVTDIDFHGGTVNGVLF